MINTIYNKNTQHKLGLRLSLAIWICISLIASTAISMPNPYIKNSYNNPESPECSNLLVTSVEILKPTRDTAYFFDEFEVPLIGIHLPVIFGGITCRAEVNISDGVVPDFLQWRFANWLGDTWWSNEYSYIPGKTKYEHYVGNLNFGQFKIWIKCFDNYNNVICEDTISCLKIF